VRNVCYPAVYRMGVAVRVTMGFGLGMAIGIARGGSRPRGMSGLGVTYSAQMLFDRSAPILGVDDSRLARPRRLLLQLVAHKQL
jgi:hypothetical protein